jgi:hypothetical protein
MLRSLLTATALLGVVTQAALPKLGKDLTQEKTNGDFPAVVDSWYES